MLIWTIVPVTIRLVQFQKEEYKTKFWHFWFIQKESTDRKYWQKYQQKVMIESTERKYWQKVPIDRTNRKYR